MDVQMSTTHQTTDDAIFQHPFARPLWKSLITCNGGMCDRYMTEDQLLA